MAVRVQRVGQNDGRWRGTPIVAAQIVGHWRIGQANESDVSAVGLRRRSLVLLIRYHRDANGVVWELLAAGSGARATAIFR